MSKIKVTLLGDSIRLIGYGLKVPELLGDEYEVYQPDDNCRYTKYTLRNIHTEWADAIKGSDVIHWNNGIWDVADYGDGVFTRKEEYVSDMLRIAEHLKKTAGRVIFATTTPVRGNSLCKNSDIVAYNELIVPELVKMGIEINDLYSLVNEHLDTYVGSDLVHLTQEGIDACAKQVVRSIKSIF